GEVGGRQLVELVGDKIAPPFGPQTQRAWEEDGSVRRGPDERSAIVRLQTPESQVLIDQVQELVGQGPQKELLGGDERSGPDKSRFGGLRGVKESLQCAGDLLLDPQQAVAQDGLPDVGAGLDAVSSPASPFQRNQGSFDKSPEGGIALKKPIVPLHQREEGSL